MGHCIAEYLINVVAGDYAVYKMLRPERLTIEILITDGDNAF